jgi:hypothetical protein
MTNIMRDSFLDPFAARNLGIQPSDRTAVYQSPGNAAPAPLPSDTAGVRWWIEQYENAGRALMGNPR